MTYYIDNLIFWCRGDVGETHVIGNVLLALIGLEICKAVQSIPLNRGEAIEAEQD
jgi:hypothetical protein